MNNADWIDAAEVAELVGCTKRWAAEHITKLPGFPHPRRWGLHGRRYWRREAVLQWRDQQEQPR